MVHHMRCRFAFALLGLQPISAVAQQFEASPPPKGESKPAPYLASHDVDFGLE